MLRYCCAIMDETMQVAPRKFSTSSSCVASKCNVIGYNSSRSISLVLLNSYNPYSGCRTFVANSDKMNVYFVSKTCISWSSDDLGLSMNLGYFNNKVMYCCSKTLISFILYINIRPVSTVVICSLQVPGFKIQINSDTFCQDKIIISATIGRWDLNYYPF